VAVLVNDFIFNILPAQGPTIPNYIPYLSGIPINSPLVGAFFGMVVSVCIALYSIKRTGDSNRKYINVVERSTTTQIDAIKNASEAQIAEQRLWIDLKRKQLLKALVKEMKLNIKRYEQIINIANQNNYGQLWLTLRLPILEYCLVNTPLLDDDKINQLLLALYFSMAEDNDRIYATRATTQEPLCKIHIDKIINLFNKNKPLFEKAIKDLSAYERSIQTSNIAGPILASDANPDSAE
jgi:hypothetical protein